MICQHVFMRGDAGEVACILCHALDDEMEQTREPPIPK